MAVAHRGSRRDAVTQPPSAAPQPRSVRLAGVDLWVADDKPTFWARAEAGDWEPETLAALAAGGKGTAADKYAALKAAGVTTVNSPAELGAAMKRAL
jgi:hypothetical protein